MDKLDLILNELQAIKTEQQRQGELLTQLIGIVKSTNEKASELKVNLADTKDTLHIFRSETGLNFKRLDRRIKLIESDLDETMQKVEELAAQQN